MSECSIISVSDCPIPDVSRMIKSNFEAFKTSIASFTCFDKAKLDWRVATRQSNLALSKHVNEAIEVLKASKFDLIILETSGIGQSDTEIIEHSDTSLYVMTPEFGAAAPNSGVIT